MSVTVLGIEDKGLVGEGLGAGELEVTVTDTGGASTTVVSSVTGATGAVTGIDVSSLAYGSLTVAAKVSDAALATDDTLARNVGVDQQAGTPVV